MTSLGFSISGRRPASEAVEVAAVAERLGYEEVWLTEDYCERGAFVVAGAVALATTRVRVGLGVLNPWTRHPMLTAMETAALAELAPGRVILGLGASNEHWMEHDLGIPFRRPLTMLEESVQVVRTALDGGHVTHRGDGFDVDAGLAFAPPGPIPIVLGVKGPRAIDLAGRVSDGIVLSILSASPYISWVRERVGSAVPLRAYVVFSCDDDPTVARQGPREVVATYLGVHGDHPITRRAGLPPALAASFREGWLGGEARVDLVTDALLDVFAVAGTPGECVAGLAALGDAGVDTILIRDDIDADVERLLEEAAAAHGRAPQR